MAIELHIRESGVIRQRVVPPARANDTFPRFVYFGQFWARPGDEGLKSVGSCGELGSDPTVDASVEDIEREGTAGEDLIMEGLEIELGS